ncbi:hypothetical protein OF83DRAFT_1101473 [Amylostereum chailletii]|nr:hypothetical protein OF83DRAFT_1101473 [Amylostereum chailletii]
MPSLTDHIDRVANASKLISSSASATCSALPSSGGPFTRAILYTPLGDLIRECDTSEIGLFTLVPPVGKPLREAENSGTSEVTRIEVVSATPLRKHAATRQDMLRPKEPEPEVYAIAALKYLDRYGSIRPMPRARSQVTTMLEQLEEIRQNMHSLNDALKQAHTTGPLPPRPASPKSLAATEEQRIEDLQTRIEQMQQRKEALQRKRPAMRSLHPKPAPVASTVARSDSQEDAFWNTPGAPARTLQFSDELLMDEPMDLGDITTSFTSPVAQKFARLVHKLDSTDEDSFAMPNPSNNTLEGDEGGEELPEDFIEEEDHNQEEGQDSLEDATVVQRHHVSVPPQFSPKDYPEDDTSVVDVEPNHEPIVPPSAPFTEKKQKIRVTADVERIVTKIWSSVGEIIMPGHPYDVSGGGDTKPPRAKETIAHLQDLSSQMPAPPSPTSSSLSSASLIPPRGQTTVQQVLTAHMLLALLMSAPDHSLPLNKLKEILTAKAGPRSVGSLTGQGATKVLYGCVAKRLVRIDRGGGEQIVRFDV